MLQGPSSASKGPYRPLSPRVGPAAASAASLRPRQVIVSSPGSPSSSSDSQSGSESVKHCLPNRVSSPAVRCSPSALPSARPSPAAALTSPGVRRSPSLTSAASPGPRNSPSITSLSRASPSVVSRSSSPAMQASSAGLNVTLGGATPSFSTLSGLQSTVAPTSMHYGFVYSQPTTYASTNPFLTGAYLSYTPGETSYGDKFNTIGSTKEVKSFFDAYANETSKYSSLIAKTSSYDSDSIYTASESKYNTLGGKSGYLTPMDMKYSPSKAGTFDTSPNMTAGSSSGLLNVEETPTPTSSIETEDSNTREVGEKDVEGDGEQSD